MQQFRFVYAVGSGAVIVFMAVAFVMLSHADKARVGDRAAGETIVAASVVETADARR